MQNNTEDTARNLEQAQVSVADAARNLWLALGRPWQGNRYGISVDHRLTKDQTIALNELLLVCKDWNDATQAFLTAQASSGTK